MQIRLKSLHLENFKGIQNITMDFSRRTNIHGANATGKTTIFDGFTWLLFNKDSTGNEKFDIRPLDAEGKRIDNVEIKVTALLDVDGTEVELSLFCVFFLYKIKFFLLLLFFRHLYVP